MTGSGVLCEGPTGSVDLSIAFTGGTGPWVFVYSIAGVNQPPITTSNNPYILTITQPGNIVLVSVNYPSPNCPGTVTGSTNIPISAINVTNSITPDVCGASVGGINLTVTPATSTFTYIWSNGATTQDLTSILFGSYSVTITNQDACTETATYDVPNNTVAITITGTTTANTTCTGGNGAIDISVSPNNTYVYLWSNGATTQDLSNIVPGTYTVTVSQGTTCSSTASYTVADQPNEPAITSTTTPSTCDLPNGAINITVTGGVTPYTFNWSNGATTEDLSNVLAGSYTVTVTGANGCTKTASISLTNNNPPFTVTNVIAANTSCNSSGTGSINLTVAPPATYTFTWSNGATTEDLADLQPGTYSVTVSAGGTCTSTGSYTVPNQPNEPAITSTTTTSTCDLPNGAINITVTGGVTPYTFSWSNGATTEDLSNILSGNYTVTVTGANGCTKTATISVNNNNPPFNVADLILPNTSCNGNGTGNINLTVTPVATYTFTWSNGATTEDLANLQPGTYSVTVSAGGTCTQAASYTVPDQPNQPSINVATTPSSCDLPNGDINITVSGGVPPYTFTWSNGATTEDLIDVLAGGYSVTVTGANGCTQTANPSLTNINPPINITSTIQASTTCNGNGNGSISVNVAPAGPYTYTWSTGATTPNLTNLLPGTYSVTVSAGGTCTQSSSFTVPDQPNNPVITSTVTPANCGLSNGGATVGVSGGVSPFTYNWSTGDTGNGITGVPGGSYSVTVTGANGCTSTAAIAIPNNQIVFTVTPTINPNTTCNGQDNGSISLSVSPVGNYTYNWSNGSTGTSITGLAPGSYSVTVSAGGTCTQALSITVPNQPNVPTITTLFTPANCGLPNGSATIIPGAGVPPYIILWSTGVTDQTITNVVGGSYSVTVTGANGCTTATSVGVPNNNIPINASPVVVANTSCVSGNGSITLNATPPNVTYQWSNGANTPNLTNLAPGNYAVTISAGGTCTLTNNFTIPNDSEPPSLSYDATPTVCNLTNGAIDLTIQNGIPPYQILWSNGTSLEDLNNIATGTYSVIVTTAMGCTATTTINVPNNNISFDVNGSTTGNSSCGFPNGSVQLNVTPFGTYTYQWNNGETTSYLSDVPAGAYTVTVSAGGTCTQVVTYQVFDFISYPTLSTTPTSATCNLPNGSINLTVTNGQTPYTYQWSNNATTEDLSGVAQGTYTVTVSDANFCAVTASANVGNNSPPINVTGVQTPNSSCAVNNGALNITVSPSGSYTYLWSSGPTTEDLTGIAAGSYTVTVSAGGSCTSSASFTVTNITSNPTLSPNITAAICGASNGAIDLTVTGATTPYTFIWSNNATTEDITALPSGNYTVTVTGANGCSSTATYNVANNSSTFSVSGTEQPLSSCTANNGSINLTITPSGSYGILWSNNATTEDLSGLAAGTYTVTVTESGSCTASASFVILDQTSYPAISQSVTAELCGLSDGAVNLTVSGGTTPYTFNWSGGQTTEDLTGIAAGTYDVTVTGVNGCSTTASATVPGNTIAFSVNGTAAANTSCDINNGGIDVTVSPAGTYNFTWSNSATSEDLSGLAGGTYSVTVSAGGNCTSEADFIVGSTTLDPVISQNVTPAICGESNGAINLTVSGGVSPFTFDWSGGQTTEDLNGIVSGSYSVEVTGGNGCVANASFNVPNNSTIFTINGTPSANTSCDTPDGLVNITVTPSGTYTYIWSNNETSEDIANLSPGSYTVTVTQGISCTAEVNFTVGNNTNAPNFTPSVSAAACGLATGAIDLTTTGGTLPYTFQWSGGQTTEDLNGIVGGSYGVTVTGADGCSNTGSYTVPDDAVLFSITDLVGQNTACTGGNGSVDLTVTPAGTYTYIWSNNQTTQDIANLPSGSYTVTVSAGGTCTSATSFNVPFNPNLPAIQDVVTASVCGAPDGGIDLTVSGGTLPYQFAWSNNATTEDLTGINAGNYTVTVTAANGCTATGTFNVPNNSNTFSFTGVPFANTLCGNGNGSVNITVTPSGTYTFIWSTGETTEDINGLVPGTYDVTISDGGSCIASASYIVGNNSPAVILSGSANNVLCFGASTGSINLTPSGGVTPYTFNWSPGIPGNPEDPAALAVGSYAVTATDASGCTSTASFNIGQPSSATQLNCAQSGNVSLPGMTDGEGTVTISGGTAPYTVDWSPGGQQAGVAAGSFVISNLGEGSYTVAVTDANGCPVTCGFTISTNDCVTAIGSMSTAPQSLCGTGCITVNYSTIGQYLDTNDVLQFVLHTGTGNQILNEILRSDQPVFCFDAALMSYGVTYYVSAVAGDDDGTGNVLLSDPCTQVTIGAPIVFYPIPVAGVNQPAPLTCVVNSVALQGTSSISGSTFAWTTAGGGIISGNPNQANVQATAAGTYTLTVSANGCTGTASLQVIDLETQVTVSITSSPGEILDCTISEITLSASATGTGNPNYVWYQNGVQVGTGISLGVQAGGTYQVVAFDPQSSCADTTSVVIDDNTEFPPLDTDPAPLLNCQDTAVTVSGSSPINGVTYFWATINGTDTTIIGQGQSTSVNAPGTYYFIGVAPNGCENAEAVVVSGDYAAPSANAGPDQVLDCVQTPIDITGSGSSNLTFFWSSNEPGVTITDPNSPVITVNQDGIYTLTVTSLGNYCTDSDDVEVFQYENVPQAEILTEDPDCFGNENGTITVVSNPDDGPYQYQLNGQNYGGQNFFAPLAPGVYQIQVTDGQGCVWSTEVYLTEPEELVVNLGADILLNLGETATLQAQYTVPASQLDTIIWTPSELLPCPQMPCDVQEITPVNQTVVTVTVIDTNGCRAEDLLTLFVKKDNPVYIPNSFSPNADGTNDVFMIFAGESVLKVKQFLVFSRWGETVYEYYNFEPNNPAYGWNGKHRDELLNPAVFVWFAVIEFVDGSEKLFEGDVSLMR
ncbi:MAG: gliding motility-associated C-terminal domain-containing protein [Bacteroidetes bacterium]|nr:gliding motility-associated C-terminal domain-containing protein [Bacteroidota bacterium]